MSDPFDYNNKPTEAMIVNMEIFRRRFADVHAEILKHVPEGSRERSIALTKLEEASFWLNRAITHPNKE